MIEEIFLKSNLKARGLIKLKCMNCLPTLNVQTGIDKNKQKRKKGEFTGFHKFYTFDKKPFFNFLFNDRLRRLIRIIDFESNKSCVGLDIGCNVGHFSRYLAYQINGTVIGTDLSRESLYRGKFLTNWGDFGHTDTEFILADVNHLPFRNRSFDLVVCASVLEHIRDLSGALTEIGNAMKDNGNLVAGYPIESDLFLLAVKLFRPNWMAIRDPKMLGRENFDKNPSTHKQSFTIKRSLLQQKFLFIYREKSFFTILPDAMSWYECAKLKKKLLRESS